MRLLIALLVWAGAAAAAVAVSSVVTGSIHTSTTTTSVEHGGSGSDTGPSGGTTTGDSQRPFDASTVKATDPLSLFRTANLARVLAIVRGQLGSGAKVEMLALYPGYLSMTAVSGGKEVDVYVDAQGGNRTFSVGGSPAGSPVFSLSRVGADVPAALAHRIATAGHVPESQLRYMVIEIDPTSPQIRWLVYTNPGNRVEYFQASGATGPLFEFLTNGSRGLQPVRG